MNYVKLHFKIAYRANEIIIDMLNRRKQQQKNIDIGVSGLIIEPGLL